MSWPDPPRIVSLIASATEIVAALGLENALVGRSHECDYPPSVAELPACSEPRIDVNGSSRQIDDRVKSVLQSAISVYRVHSEMLERLQPTHVITQTQCEVCAVSLKDVERAVCELTGTQPQVVSLEPMALNDVWNDIHRVAGSLGVEPRADELVGSLRQRLSDLEAKTSQLSERPTIGCIEWTDPLMCAGNWVPELVRIAGGRDVFGKAGKHSPYMSWDDLSREDPDVIALMPCGFDIERTHEETQVLVRDSRWQQLRAVQSGRVFLTDGNQYFNRPGPRLVESAEILAEILHPSRFNFGHEETGWRALQ
ncbi:MAG: cobalamin-binding protein [Planctomycetota bacterium]|nr:MAG: cobalamin-binding protein [Planctomycetota bacterium]REK35720.1 MAG: cobalamin-binding protein [Planctomycetota bacterium]